MRDTVGLPAIDPTEVLFQRFTAHVIEELDRRQAERFADLKAQVQQMIRFSTPIHLDQETIVHTKELQRFVLDNREIGSFCHVIENGEWEGHVQRVFRKVLRAGSVMIDVGANVGFHSVFCAALVGHEGRIHSIEADPVTVGLLKRNLHLNNLHPRTTIHLAACIEESGRELTFTRLAEEPMMSGLVVPAWKAVSMPSTEIVVRSIALKDISDVPVDLLKIDVEGAEVRVLRGSGNVVGRDTVCVVEILPTLLEDVSGPGAFLEVLAFFQSRGFKMLRVRHFQEPLLIEGDWSEEIGKASGDFAFVHPEGRHAGAFGL